MSDGHPDAAAREFGQVAKLQPNDKVATDMLKLLTPPPQLAQSSAAATAQPDQAAQPTPALNEAQPPVTAPNTPETAKSEPDLPPIDQSKIIGGWKATREDGSQFELTLSDDKKFHWKFTPKGQKPQEFDGTYTVDGGVLALESKERGALIAGVTQDGDSKFNFKLVGAPPEDPGLNFTKG
jgi:hypothetical protein